MDERQAQIRERAGLEESRLNEEFIDWLRKWGTPILLVVAVLAVGYNIKDRWHKARDSKLDAGFEELAAATTGGNSSPDTLLSIASTYDGHAAISSLARLDAADAYLDAIRRGVKPGAVLKTGKDGSPTGELDNPEDALTDADRTSFLKLAGDLYQQVYDKSSSESGQQLLTINALYGLAAIAECRQEFDKAKGYYEQIAKLADASSLPAHAALANERIKTLPDLVKVPKLFTKAELPPPPKPEEPPAPVVTPAAAPPGAPAAGTPAPSAAPVQPSSPVPPPTTPAPAPAPTPEPSPAPATPTPAPAAPPAPPK
jgi:hypothetical protein